METVWLGIGSNLGESEGLIRSAIAQLETILRRMRVSGLWRSKARYVENQPDFINAVVAGETDLSPQDLLRSVNQIEASLGRDRANVPVKGPRTIDIDILLYGKRIIAESNLVVPHPGIRERKFVLLPLLELDDSMIDPVTQRPFREYLAELPRQGIYPTGRGIYDAPYP